MYGVPSWRQFAPLLILPGLGLVLPGLVPEYFLFLLNSLLIYLVLALGLDILLGRAGQFAFAHTAFFGIGCYGTALLNARLGVPFPIGMPMAAALAGVIGLLVAIPAIRLRNVYLALATFAFAEGASWVFNAWTAVTNGPNGLRVPVSSIAGLTIRSDGEALPFIALVAALMLAATLLLNTSQLGRHLAAIRDSEHVALASGVDVARTKISAFVISAVFAGVAGGLYTLHQSFISPDLFSFNLVVLLLSMIVVGGLGTLPGVLIGVALLGLLPEVLRTVLRSLQIWQELIYGGILIGCVMFMPRGLWGLAQSLARRRT